MTSSATTAPSARPAQQSVPVPTWCRPARTDEELAHHHAIRREVFVQEQHLFTRSDGDVLDGAPGTVHVLGYAGADPAGAVRLYPLGHDGLWQGDRLAVRRGYRAHHLGAPLVRYAVATAGCRGGRRMVAHVQLPNVEFFTHLGWAPVGAVELYVGQPHQQMVIDLPERHAAYLAARALEAHAALTGAGPSPR